MANSIITIVQYGPDTFNFSHFYKNSPMYIQGEETNKNTKQGKPKNHWAGNYVATVKTWVFNDFILELV